MSEWKYLNEDKTIVGRQILDGSDEVIGYESRSIEDAEISKLLSDGYVPLPYKTDAELLIEKKAVKIKDLDNQMGVVLSNYPCPLFGGKTVLLSDQQQNRITGNSLLARLAILGDTVWGETETWPMNDGTFGPIETPEKMVNFGIWARGIVKHCIDNYRVHKQAIHALTSLEAVEDYDISSGWSA